MKIRFNQKELQKLSVKDRRKAERWARTHGFAWQLNQKLNAYRKEKFGIVKVSCKCTAERKKRCKHQRDPKRLMRNARKVERQEALR